MATNTLAGQHIVTDGQVGTRVYVGNTTPGYPTIGDLWIDNQGGTYPSGVRWSKTAAGGETSLSGTDDSTNTLSYTVGAEQVYINGVLQVRGSDYTATNGTSITGLTALVASDVVTVFGYPTSVVSGSIPLSTVAAKGDLLVATGASTVTNLGIGVQYQTLIPDTTQASGVRWADDNNILTIMGAYI